MADSFLIQVGRQDSLRSSYKEANLAFSKRFFFQIGEGVGFCAEMISLLKMTQLCLQNDIQFCISVAPEPKGYAVKNGWEDYFLPLFPIKKNKILGALNRSHFPLGRVPILKQLSRIILKLTQGNHYYMFDQFDADYDGYCLRDKLSIQGDYWEALRVFVDSVWVLNDKTQSKIVEYGNELSLNPNEKYIGIHVRRGDKITESPYTAVRDYVDVILKDERLVDLPIYLASDDVSVYQEFEKHLGEKYKIHYYHKNQSKGFDQRAFNEKTKENRWRDTVFFLFELEMLKRANVFIGSSPSNVFYWVRYMRGNNNIIDLGKID